MNKLRPMGARFPAVREVSRKHGKGESKQEPEVLDSMTSLIYVYLYTHQNHAFKYIYGNMCSCGRGYIYLYTYMHFLVSRGAIKF